MIETVVSGKRLTFDPERHRYELDGRPVPGITAVLRSAGLLDSMPQDSGAMKRGEFAHLATELDDKGDLDEATLDPALKGYVEAWRKAKRELGLEILGIEVLAASPIYRYATRIDRIALRNREKAIINLKSGNVYPHYAIQIAGEAILCGAADFLDVKRMGVHLKENGEYKVFLYGDPREYDIFFACLKIFWFKERQCPTLS